MRTRRFPAPRLSPFAADVRRGLLRPGQKELPSKYLYDALGSALFEAICELPEYGLTRAEERLLKRHAEEIAARWPPPAVVVELGSGTGRKTRVLLEALTAHRHVVYSPIEISRTALEACRREMADLRTVRVQGYEREYLDGLSEVAESRPLEGSLLVLFLGSTIGNFDREAMPGFLRGVRRHLRAGDALLLGADLEKDVDTLLAAYDDPLGVTAAFNRNLLVRIARELDADCDPRAFAHQAVYRKAERRIEMHLLARCDQRVLVPGAGVDVEVREGETIWTESCHKFSLLDLRQLAHEAGFRAEAQWVDRDWPFAECLWVAD